MQLVKFISADGLSQIETIDYPSRAIRRALFGWPRRIQDWTTSPDPHMVAMPYRIYEFCGMERDPERGELLIYRENYQVDS